MKYTNIRNGKVVAQAEFNEKTKTYLLVFEDGKSTSCTSSTFKRWYRKIEDDAEYVAEVMEQKKELGIECPPIESYAVVDTEQNLSDAQYAEIGKEIAEQAKEKAKKKAVNTRVFGTEEMNNTFTNIGKKLNSAKGISYMTYEKLPRLYVVRCGKTSVFEVRVNRTGVVFNCKASDIPEGYDFYTVSNYYRPAVVRLVEGYEELLDKLITYSLDNYYKEEN